MNFGTFIISKWRYKNMFSILIINHKYFIFKTILQSPYIIIQHIINKL